MNQKAGFWLRVLALTIDEIILVLLTYLLYQWLKPIILTPWSESIWFILIFYECIDYNYYTLFWFLGGQTIGKMLVRTKIVKIDGSKFTYKDAFVRYWIWMIGVALLGIGYFWIAWQKNKQGWNDIAAKTYVIKI